MDETVLSGEHNSSIVWLESSIRETVTQSCPCGTLQESEHFNNSATRVCGGSYSFGGEWREPQIQSCEYNAQNQDITLELCQLTTVSDENITSTGQV